MTYPLNVTEVLNDIEFEIAQGVIRHEGLGEAITAVRQYQNKSRAETFKAIKLTDPQRELFSRQYQIVDMLLNLLHEIALRLQSLQLSVQQLRQLPPELLQPVQLVAPIAPAATAPVPQPEVFQESQAGAWDEQPVEIAVAPVGGLEFRSPEEVERVIQPEAIQVELQARVIHTPLIGWLLTKLRIFYQRPALFYTQILAHRQTAVNRVFGDRILYQEELIRTQQQQIQALQARLEALEPAAGLTNAARSE